MSEDAFDWGDKGEAWWREQAREAGGVSDIALKFVVGKHAGLSNAKAAEAAGAKGKGNVTGYRLARSNMVERLTARVAAETGSDIGTVDQAEAKRILSNLARGSDPRVRISAVDSLQKIAEREEANKDDGLTNPARCLMKMLECGGSGGLLAAATTYMKVHNTLTGFPMGDQSMPLLKRDFPDWWKQMRRNCVQHALPDIDRLADGPVVEADDIVLDESLYT